MTDFTKPLASALKLTGAKVARVELEGRLAPLLEALRLPANATTEQIADAIHAARLAVSRDAVIAKLIREGALVRQALADTQAELWALKARSGEPTR